MAPPLVEPEDLANALARAGFIDAEDEARELIAAARGDANTLQGLAERRLSGEPLPWLTGYTTFLGHTVRVDPGVYVPRPQSELIAQRAIDRLPVGGLAADLATGSGALAVVLQRARPDARVVATEIAVDACRCARANGVEVYHGHLGLPIPTELVGRFDVVVAVVPYVPTEEMAFLPRDVQRFEPAVALDGGRGGLELLTQAVWWASVLLHDEGAVVLEVGGDQDAALMPMLTEAGFDLVDRLVDDDGDLRGIEAVRTSAA